MGRPLGLVMLFTLICFFCLPKVRTQSATPPHSPARALDALIQDHAYRAFVRPRTGIPYDGVAPSNLSGIQISAMRLRSGSLWNRGVHTFKEFDIPTGLIVQPYVTRLVLVYQNLGNWSVQFYPLSGYKYLAPVLGLLAYDATNLSAKNLPEWNFKVTGEPISIKFTNVRSLPKGSVAKCVWFNLSGVANFSNLLPENTCSTFEQGHFSIVVESTALSPVPSPAPISRPPPIKPAPTPHFKKKTANLGIIVGPVIGGIAFLALLALVVMWGRGHIQRKKMDQMEQASEFGEQLHMATVGSTRAPAAVGTRTQPTIETEYMPYFLPLK